MQQTEKEALSWELRISNHFGYSVTVLGNARVLLYNGLNHLCCLKQSYIIEHINIIMKNQYFAYELYRRVQIWKEIWLPTECN